MDADEILEDIVGAVLPKNDPNLTTTTEKDNLFANFDNSFINNAAGGHISSTHVCKRILYIPICEQTSVRAWDVLLFLPNLTFVLFLAIRWTSTKRKLLATHSPIFRTFHALVAINALVALFRSLIAMIVTGSLPIGDYSAQTADKTLWMMTFFTLVMTEIIVLVFGMAGAQMDSKKSIIRVTTVALFSAAVYGLCQSILEFSQPDPLFDVYPKKGSHFMLFGYGSAMYSMSISICFTLMYLMVAIIPLCPCVRGILAMPNKPSFYQYCGCLFVVHLMQAIGSGLLHFRSNPSGLCVLNFATFLYVTAYTPLVYSTFLGPFFKSAQPTLLFTYKAQVDDMEEDQVQSSGSMQFSLTQGVQLDLEGQDDQPIVRNPPALIEGLASPDSVEAEPIVKY